MKYKIKGEPLPILEIELAENESIMCEGGAMVYMSPNMELQTKGSSFSKVVGRIFSGEHPFLNIYTAKNSPGKITLGSSMPGAIVAVDILPDKPIIVQKRSFLAAETTIDVSVFWQKKLRTGFFGGEGFIMQKLAGKGMAFLELDGYIEIIELAVDEEIIVSTGHLAAMEHTVKMDIKTVGRAKDMFLSGEGFFNTVLTGPGKVYLQSMRGLRKVAR